MVCVKHPGRMVAVCGEVRCAGCFEAELMAQPLAEMNPPKGRVVTVWDESKHRMVMTVVRT